MPSQSNEEAKESSTLLSDDPKLWNKANGQPDGQHMASHENPPKFSVLKARIVSASIPMFCLSATIAREILLPQYLVYRRAEDAGYGNISDFGPCFNNLNDTRIEIINKLQAQVSEELMYYHLIVQIPAFFTCLFIGTYVDSVGRRLLLLVPVFTSLAKTVVILFIIKFHLDLQFMYLAHVIDGISGSWFSLLIVFYSIMADLTTSKEDRSFWIYLMACLIACTAALVNLAVGLIVDSFGFFQATLFLCAMMSFAFIVPLLFLPETLPCQPALKRATPLTNIRKVLGFYFLDGSLRRRATFCVCLLIFAVGVANELSVESMDSLYQMHTPFCWSSTKIGEYTAVRIAGTRLAGILWLKLLQKFLAIELIAMFGLFFQACAYIFEAFIQESWQFYLVPVLGFPYAPTVSILRTMFSVLAGHEHQGAIFSSIAVVETVCNLGTSQIYNRIYSSTVSRMPGAVYLVMAGVSILTVCLFGIYFLIREKPAQERKIYEKQ